jgi:class 3 adenylate cyclase
MDDGYASMDADRTMIVGCPNLGAFCCERFERDTIVMRRKIAAILVAHIADYGRLVAEDEEETLRRLASYRTTTNDLIAIAGGRIFNAAGDAFLAEFPSAVDAVRCAIDIQESLRTRSLAYPDSRQMSYRIGIGIGDVVERDGDLLGDGVNIAARLEGLAEPGGICISRAVHEQVTNKLSARFVDIGARKVKNIPEPVHAFLVVTWDEGRIPAMPRVSAIPTSARSATKWLSVGAIGAIVLCTAAIALLHATQRPDDKALSSSTAAAALPPAPTPPSPGSSTRPTSSSPATSPTPVPPIRRTSSAKSESDTAKRSLQSCQALASQRGWGSNETRGKTAFIDACMKGDLE